MTMHRALPRRTVLRGVGATLALPFLDAMVPAFARTARAAAAPNRMVFVYVPNGIVMPEWTPETAGPIAPLPAALPRVLEPMIPYRSDISVLSGLTHNGGRALGDGPGDHARAGASYLTGVHPRKTYGADIQAGVSADQIAARHLGGETRFGSLELGCEPGLLGGNCDSGYSCAYSNSISWRTPPRRRCRSKRARGRRSSASSAPRTSSGIPPCAPASGATTAACSTSCWETPAA